MDNNQANLIIRCAIDLCGINIICEADDLAGNTLEIIKKYNLIDTNSDEVKTVLDSCCRGAFLFCGYRNNLEKIKSVEYIKSLQRRLWLYNVLVVNYKNINTAVLRKRIERMYADEKSLDANLSAKYFELFEIMDRYIRNDETIRVVGSSLECLKGEMEAAYPALVPMSEKLECEYLPLLYGEEDANKVLDLTQDYGEVRERKSGVTGSRTRRAPEAQFKTDRRNGLNGFSFGEDRDIKAFKETERTLRDTIRVLQNDKRDLGINLSHAKKDAIREVLCSLTDSGYGAPLNELYVLLKDGTTPDKIKGVINNFFVALGGAGIRIKEKQYDEVITLDADNEKKYDPIPNEDIRLGDEVVVVYPGYWFEGETMVRPIVKKYHGGEK